MPGLADATHFAWGQAYLFEPYMARGRVCAILHIAEADCTRQIPFQALVLA